MLTERKVQVRPATEADASGLAALMVNGLQTRLDLLGPGFVRLLHRHMAVSPHCVCPLAERNGEILGYTAAFTSTRRFYLEFALRRGFRAGFIVLPRLLRPGTFHTFFHSVTYPGKAMPDDPAPEFVSLVVAPEARRLGLGRALVQAVLDELRSRGLERVLCKIRTDNQASNSLFLKLGFELIRTEPFYGSIPVNVYVYKLV